MYSYSYNRESISRVDELLNRNERIYQNLKLQLNQINKSNLNIHRNIHIIHEHEQQGNQFIQTGPMNLEDSSSVFLENKLREPLSLQDQNMSSIEGSKVGEQSYLESSRKKSSQREEYTLNFENSKSGNIDDEGVYEELEREKTRNFQEKAKRIEQLSLELQQSKLSQEEGSFEQDKTAYLQIQNRISPKSASGPPSRILKGNSIYLQAIPKTQTYPQLSQQLLQEIPTFRDEQKESQLKVREEERMIKEQWIQELARQQRIEKVEMEDKQSRAQRQEKELSFHLEASRQGTYGNQNISTPESNFAASELLNYTPTDLLSNSNRFEASRNKTDSFKFDCWGVSPQKSYSQSYKEVSRERAQEQRQSDCYLFAPFNKVYRSPILQVKSQGMILLQRKSKTTLGLSNTSDPLKFKPRHTLTDEQTLIRHLLTGSDSLDFSKLKSSRIAILGGKDTLKKKLHLALLAYLFQAASHLISLGNVEVKVEHQESGQTKPLQTIIEGRRGAEKVYLLQLERLGEDISRIVMNTKKDDVLRATRVRVEGERGWEYNIVSSNRVQVQFARCLGADRICWSVNPLVKNYDDVLHTLQTLTRFQQQK